MMPDAGCQMPGETGNRQLATGKRDSDLKVPSFFGREKTTISRNSFNLQEVLPIANCQFQ
jgi:hypothetical protein